MNNGKTPNQMPKIRGSTIMRCRHVRCNFSGGWDTPDPTGIPSPDLTPSVTLVPRSMPRFRSLDACDTTIPSNFLPISTSLSVLKMYWVVLTVDCRNSVCRNRVCLPVYAYVKYVDYNMESRPIIISGRFDFRSISQS